MAGTLLCLGVVTAPAFAEDRRAADPFELHLGLDSAVLATGLVLWITPSLANRAMPGPACDPCETRHLNALDRTAVGSHSDGANVAADVLSVALPAASVAACLLHRGEHGWRGVGTDTFLILQAMAISGALHQIVRHAVRRPRPFMYASNLGDAETRGDVEATLSFYSGHTATVFAAASAFSHLYFVRRPRSWTRWLVLVGSLAAASALPLMRVASGEHFPTDVMVGAAVGSAIGFIVPALHRRRDNAVILSTGATPGLWLTGHF